MRDGRVRRAYLGVVGGPRPLPPPLAHDLGRPRGLEVVQLLDRSPAAAAGVRPGDLIVELDGRPIRASATCSASSSASSSDATSTSRSRGTRAS